MRASRHRALHGDKDAPRFYARAKDSQCRVLRYAISQVSVRLTTRCSRFAALALRKRLTAAVGRVAESSCIKL